MLSYTVAEQASVGLNCEALKGGHRRHRYHVRRLMQSINAEGAEVSDSQLDAAVLAWARQRVVASGRSAHQLTSFSDRSLATGLFLIDLLAAVEPASIDYRIVTPGDTAEERALNARLVISAASKIGCSLPLVWEDIAEARNPKVILAFIAAVLAHATRKASLSPPEQ